MRPTRFALLCLLTSTALAGVARADSPALDRVYHGADLRGFFAGASLLFITSSDWDDRYGAGLETGYRFAPRQASTLRHGPSLQTGYYPLKTGSGSQRVDFDLIPLVANYSVAAEVVDHIWVYGGAGAGLGFVDIDPRDQSGGSDQVGLWQAFVGMEGAVTEWASVRGGYRHMWVDDMSGGDVRISSDNASIFELGVNFWY